MQYTTLTRPALVGSGDGSTLVAALVAASEDLGDPLPVVGEDSQKIIKKY